MNDPCDDGMRCRICRTLLTQRQAMYCSTRCQIEGQRRLSKATPTGKARATPVADAVLAVLKRTTETWLTVSDLAIWTYGDDDRTALGAMRVVIWRLRRRGHDVAHRRATWSRAVGPARAYRLLDHAPLEAEHGAGA